MEGTTKSPTFAVEFDKVCPCCGADCPNFEIEEEYNYWIYDMKIRQYHCANEGVCKANYEKYKEMERV